MGDRRMAEIKTTDGSLFVYTHLAGTIMPQESIDAIYAAKDSWGDEPYATRIIVDQLTKSSRDQATGYGLMLTPNAEDSYNGHQPSIIIDLVERTFTVLANGVGSPLSFDSLSELISKR